MFAIYILNDQRANRLALDNHGRTHPRLCRLAANFYAKVLRLFFGIFN